MSEPSTPSSKNFFMPAEWEPHSSTWLAWPHNTETWKSDDLREVESIYIEIIQNLIIGENINILALEEGNDVVIVEIGGTVGDIESLPFLEAVRQLRTDLGRENTLFVHLTYVPYIAAAGELKTKPTQHSVKDLLQIGIQPDVLLCRTDRFLADV